MKALATVLLGKAVWVDWPYMVECEVAAVSDTSGKWTKEGVEKVVDMQGRHGAITELGEKLGVKLGSKGVPMVHVKRQDGLHFVVQDGDVQVHKRFGKQETMYPVPVGGAWGGWKESGLGG